VVKFPTFEESTTLNAGSPTEIASSSDARIRGNTLAQFGGEMAKLGDALAQEQAESAFNQAKVESEKALQYAEANTKNGGADIPELAQAEYDKNLSGIKANMDPLALGKADRLFDHLDSEFKTQALKSKVQTQVATLKITREQNDQVVAGNVLNDPTLAASYIDDNDQKYAKQKSEGIPDYISRSLHEKSRDVIAGSYVEGMLVKGKNDISFLGKLKRELGAQETSATVKILSSEAGTYGLSGDKDFSYTYKYPDNSKVDPKMTQVLSAIRPELRKAALEKIESAFAAHTKTKLSLLNKQLDAMATEQAKGNVVIQGDFDKANAWIKAIPDTDSQAQYQQKLENIKALGQIADVSINYGYAQATAYLEQLRSPEDAPALQKKATDDFIEKAKGILQNIEKQKSEDPAKFSLAHAGIEWGLKDAAAAAKDGSPEAVQNYNTKLAAYQKHAGLPISYITNEDAKARGIGIAAATKLGTDEIVKQVNTIKQQYGDDTQSVMHDIVRNSKDALPESATLLGVLSDPQAIKRVADNMAKRDVIREEFKKSETNYKDLNEQMRSFNDQFAETFFGNKEQRYSPAIQALKSEMEIEAMRISNEEGVAISTATGRAYKTVVDNNFWVMPVGSNSVFVPKADSYNSKTINAFLQDNNPGRGTIAAQGGKVVYQDGRPAGPFSIENTKDFDPAKLTNSQLRDFRDNARLVTTEDHAGVQLVMDRGGKLQPVLDKEGKPMMKSFKELSNYNPSDRTFIAPTAPKELPVFKPNIKVTPPKDVTTPEKSSTRQESSSSTLTPHESEQVRFQIKDYRGMGLNDQQIIQKLKDNGFSEDDFYNEDVEGNNEGN
jgi:hypothetical protein